MARSISTLSGEPAKRYSRGSCSGIQRSRQVWCGSYPTIKHWIDKGKLRTVKTPGGHHRIPEDEIEKHLRATLGAGSCDKWKIRSDKISESNQLVGRILGFKVDGLIAEVTISTGTYRLTSIITADAASELRLKIGDNVVALLNSSQVMIVRKQV
jgi:molybdopterin-binding protein